MTDLAPSGALLLVIWGMLVGLDLVSVPQAMIARPVVAGAVAGWWAVLGFLVVYNLSRIATGVWALRTGLESGMTVGNAISHSWISKAVERVGPAAGFTVGAAIPLVGAWYLEAIGWPAAFGTLAVAATGVAVTRWFGPSLTTVRFTLLALVLLVVFRWLLP